MSARRTQCDAVLRLLEDGGWHSTIEFVELGVLRAPARVHELRQRGLVIDVKRVSHRNRSTTFVYRLVSGELDAACDVAASQSHELGTPVLLDDPAGAQLDHEPPQCPEPRPTPATDDVELPGLEERRRIAAEARAAFALATQGVAT